MNAMSAQPYGDLHFGDRTLKSATGINAERTGSPGCNDSVVLRDFWRTFKKCEFALQALLHQPQHAQNTVKIMGAAVA